NLLGNLSPASARDFLVLLGNLDEPFRERGTQKAVWKMLGAMVGGGREQWFALSLITGKIPHDRASRTKTQAKEATPAPSRTVSLFTHALDALSDVALVDGRPFWTRLPSELALEMLRFVAACQNNWSWAVDSEVRAHPRFIEAITKGYIRHLHREPSDSVASLTRETAMAATVAEVLAMYLHSSLQVGDAEAAVERVVPHLQYLEKYGVASPKYSTSLHSNLKTNLEKWHKGLRLESFKHTTVFPTSAGGDYYYDVEFASKVLNQRRSEGAKKLKGLEGMLRNANEELSFCDAQIGLIKSWKLLAMQLVVGVKADTPLSSLLIDVVRSCLEENARMATPTLAIFEGLRMQRVELATGVLQRVVVLEFKDARQSEALQGLFGTAWDTIRTAGFEFESVFSSAGEELAYYRGLLQILFLTLKPLTQASATRNLRKEGQPPAQATELIEVLVNIVLKGFKSLTFALHEDAHAASPSDFVLLTATLQLALRIPGIDLLFSHLALHVANQRTLQHATSLFSWADQFLLPPSDDPVYGELAILFLLELSSVPAVAEAMAVDGVLAQLASAKIMRLYTRPRGMGPFDHPARVHSIWARGVLPLCLNLLDAVGAPIAAEVVTFLNSFPNQLARLAAELANRGSAVGTRPSDSHISLSLAGEVHSLSLIAVVIERYRAAGASTGVLVNEIPSLEWERAAVKEDVEDFVLGRSVLSALVVPASEREAEIMRLRPVA
ncbi:MAG: hypothetical protein INR71_09060, partial [Terriglobus roseus]|nr:hypothetical protein [Terriglobus roseus]